MHRTTATTTAPGTAYSHLISSGAKVQSNVVPCNTECMFSPAPSHSGITSALLDASSILADHLRFSSLISFATHCVCVCLRACQCPFSQTPLFEPLVVLKHLPGIIVLVQRHASSSPAPNRK